MLQTSMEFLKREFFKYYYDNINDLMPPSPIKNREFGFFLNKEGNMLRHKCFSSLEEFHRFVLSEVPFDIYVSAANYEDPGNRDMSEKKLTNAELFFDIDAEPPSGSSEQDSAWLCQKCGQYGLGGEEKCPACGSKTDLIKLVSEEQLREALKETEKLINVLTTDFGVDREHVSVFFSGNRGYHVHVNQEEFMHITGEGRREIVDYLLIQGLEEKELLSFLRGGMVFRSRDLRGVKKRVYSRVFEMLYSTGKSKTVHGEKRILKQLENAIEELKVRIDPVVTIDMHRLMRMPGSINSNSGMVKKRIRHDELHSLNPLKEAVAFSDEETVLKVRIAPRFKLGGRIFGPFKDEEVELPVYAAVYIVCKGLGEYVGR
ncbi:MAG: DNA primase small subunit domain-containing protein [Thermoproteota archaeon]